MILYFDTYITDIPLFKAFVSPNDAVRAGCKNYAMPKKIDIAKYSLASYASYPWSNVLIKYTLDNPSDYQPFDDFVKKLFPKAIIIHGRSDNQNKYKESIEILDKMDDEWVFYAPNNDHPLIASDISIIDKLIDKAKNFRKTYPFVSILYSHFSEVINLTVEGSPTNVRVKYESDIKKIEDDEVAVSHFMQKGDPTSIRIVNKDLFKHWFCSRDLGNARIIRSEDIFELVPHVPQLVIVPKREVCAHFDGYSHLMRGAQKIRPEQVPPLFIPPGFFENSIKIAFGYDDYREGWTNINPAAKKFSFQDSKKGADLKIGLEDVPLFWKNRIEKIDINPNANPKKIKKGRDKYYATVRNPWRFRLLKGEFKSVAQFYYMKLFRNSIFRESKFFKTPLKSTAELFNEKIKIK